MRRFTPLPLAYPESFEPLPYLCQDCHDTGFVESQSLYRGRVISVMIEHRPCPYRDSLKPRDEDDQCAFQDAPTIEEPNPWQD